MSKRVRIFVRAFFEGVGSVLDIAGHHNRVIVSWHDRSKNDWERIGEDFANVERSLANVIRIYSVSHGQEKHNAGSESRELEYSEFKNA
jgi:hypothetical protein